MERFIIEIYHLVKNHIKALCWTVFLDLACAKMRMFSILIIKNLLSKISILMSHWSMYYHLLKRINFTWKADLNCKILLSTILKITKITLKTKWIIYWEYYKEIRMILIMMMLFLIIMITIIILKINSILIAKVVYPL